MNLIFCLSDECLLRSIFHAQQIARDAPKDLFMRLPETDNYREDIVQQRSAYRMRERSDAVVALWKNVEQRVKESLKLHCEQNALPLRADYTVILTTYGPYGSYEAPETIYASVVHDKGALFTLETVLHELLHLILSEKTKHLSYAETERYVDKTFLSLWRGIFPQYRAQNIPLSE